MKAALPSIICTDCAKPLPRNPRRTGTRCRVCTGRYAESVNSKKKPVPADFEESTKTIIGVRQLLKYHKCSNITLLRWKKETGLKTIDPRQVPASDASQMVALAATMTVAQIAAQTGRSLPCVRKVLREAGVAPFSAKKAHAAQKIRKPVETAKRGLYTIRQPIITMRAALLAALATKDGCAVSSCNAEGKYDPDGSHVRYGTAVYTFEEIAAKCRRKGLLA